MKRVLSHVPCSVFLLLCLVQYGRAKSVSHQQTNYTEQKCQEVQNQLISIGVSAKFLAENPSTGAAGEMCHSSCCSHVWEQQLLQLSKTSLEQLLSRQLEEMAVKLQSHALWIQDILLLTVREGRGNMLATFDRVYPHGRDLAHTPANQLFASFEKFFQSQLSEAQLEQSVASFFDHLLPVLYRSSQHHQSATAGGAAGGSEPLGPAFVECLRRQRSRLRPFGEVPALVAQRLLHMFGAARFYLQAAHRGAELLRDPGTRRWSQQCLRGAVRQQQCGACHGHAAAAACAGLCSDVTRECTEQLRRVLGRPWSQFVQQLSRLGESLQHVNNIRHYFSKMNANLAANTSNMWDVQGSYRLMLKAMCGSNEELAALFANMSSSTGSSTERGGPLPSKRQKRFSGVAALHIVSPLPSRNISASAYNSPTKLVETLQAFHTHLEQRRFFFDTLADSMCHDPSLRVAPANTDCWTGSHVGSYAAADVTITRKRQTSQSAARSPASAEMFVTAELGEVSRTLDTLGQMSSSQLSSSGGAASGGVGGAGSSAGRALTHSDLQRQRQSPDLTSAAVTQSHDPADLSGSGHWSLYGEDEEYESPQYSDGDYHDYYGYDDDEYSDGASGSGDLTHPTSADHHDWEDNIDVTTIAMLDTTTILIDVATESSALPHSVVSSLVVVLSVALTLWHAV